MLELAETNMTNAKTRRTSGYAPAPGSDSDVIDLGRAEFRLPLLIGVFGFAALQAIIMNKAMSLVVVITALPTRLVAVPLAELSPYWFIVLNLLAGTSSAPGSEPTGPPDSSPNPFTASSRSCLF